MQSSLCVVSLAGKCNSLWGWGGGVDAAPIAFVNVTKLGLQSLDKKF